MATTQDETLIETAFRMALLGRHLPTGLLFHSDRESQYTSDVYQALLADVSATVSMEDMEPHGQLLRQRGHRIIFRGAERRCEERACFQTRGQARQTTFKYVEYFYYLVRRHSLLGYVSPVAYEQLMS
jgi:putative transposase